MELPHQAVRSRRTARLLATFLAIGGVGWGALCLLLVIAWKAPLALAIFAPGYLVTVGCIVLAVSNPAVRRRRFWWKLSIIVQAVWLVWFLWEEAEHEFEGFSWIVAVCAAWWGLATIGSVVGFAIDAFGQRD